MIANALLIAFFDGGSWYDSPFIIPVAGCAMIGSIAVAGIWSGVRNREIKSQERLAMIAQGLQPEPEWDRETARQSAAQSPKQPGKPLGRPSDGAGARRAGLVLCSIGVGLIAFFAFLAIVLNEREVFSGACAGILPLAIGIGFFIDAIYRRRDFELWMAMAGNAVSASSEMPSSAPPPPPAMSAAQASDWRPLH